MASHNELGKAGEDAAVDFLLHAGHRLLERNFRFNRAEVDVITAHGKYIVFTEVKTRSSNLFGKPDEFVDKKKIKLMTEAAEEYLYKNKLDKPMRFDIISIESRNGKMTIKHIEDAFFNEGGDIYL